MGESGVILQAYGVALDLPIAYVAGGTIGIAVLDVADSTDPRLLRTVGVSGVVAEVLLANDHLLVVSANPLEIHVYALDDPTRPDPVAVIPYDAPPAGPWKVVGDHLFATTDEGFRIFDVSDPTDLMLIDDTDDARAYHIDVEGGRLHVARFDRVDVYDVTDPATPARIGGVDGTRAYVMSHAPYVVGRGTIHDLTYPAFPDPLDVAPIIPSGIDDVIANGDLLHVGTVDAMLTLGAGDPTALETIATTPVDGVVLRLARNDTHVFAGVGYPTSFRVFDVTDPGAPLEVASIDLGEEYPGRQISYHGDDVYLLTSSRDLRYVDVAVPVAPVAYPIADAVGTMADITHRDDVLYGTGSDTVELFDITDRALPVNVGDVDLDIRGSVIELVGDRLYVAGEDFVILDVTSPLDPVPVAVLPLDVNESFDLEVTGAIAYVLTSEGMSIVDLADELDPTLIALLATPGSGSYWRSMTTSGCAIFAGDVGGPDIFAYPAHQALAVGVPAVIADGRTRVARPNPFRSRTRIDLDTAPDAVVEVFDVRGRRVRSLAAGPLETIWDGRADDGRVVPPGVYWLVSGGVAGRVVRVD